MMLKVMEIIGYCLLQRDTHVRSCLSPTRIEQTRLEQTVIRMLNGFSVVVNCSLSGKVEIRTTVTEGGSAQVLPLMI